jgi:hypothetical protein
MDPYVSLLGIENGNVSPVLPTPGKCFRLDQPQNLAPDEYIRYLYKGCDFVAILKRFLPGKRYENVDVQQIFTALC